MKISKLVIFITIISILLTLQLVGCSGVQSSATYPLYTDEQALIDSSDIIVVGDVIKENKAEKINISANENRTDVTYTTSDVKVSEVIKGKVNVGDVIQIKQLGDKDGIGNTEVLDNGGYYKKGSQFIFFLASFEDILSGTPYETLTPTIGHIEIIENKSKVSKENKIFKDDITKDDLVKHLKEKLR